MIENMTPQPYPLFLAEEGGNEVLLVLGWTPEIVGRVHRLSPVAVSYGVRGVRPAVINGPYAVYATRGGAQGEIDRQTAER
jgi:hypothetical protein